MCAPSAQAKDFCTEADALFMIVQENDPADHTESAVAHRSNESVANVVPPSLNLIVPVALELPENV